MIFEKSKMEIEEWDSSFDSLDCMLLSENSLEKLWDNKSDEIWDTI